MPNYRAAARAKLFQSIISHIYSRFLESNVSSCYIELEKSERELMCRNIKSDGTSLYHVSSRTEQGKYYTVDMSIGMCECFIGCDESALVYQSMGIN